MCECVNVCACMHIYACVYACVSVCAYVVCVCLAGSGRSEQEKTKLSKDCWFCILIFKIFFNHFDYYSNEIFLFIHFFFLESGSCSVTLK